MSPLYYPVSMLQVKTIIAKGTLFTTNAQDYFISTKNGYPWDTIPDFVVGRVGYDNWLVVTALTKGKHLFVCIHTSAKEILLILSLQFLTNLD